VERVTATAAHAWAELPCLREPRPNGSRALEASVESVRAWLEGQGLPVHLWPFRLRPYFMELLGLWLAAGAVALLLAAWLGPPWLGIPLALLLVAVPLAETRFLWPVISRLVTRTAQNLVVACPPAGESRREILVVAHLDSKTEGLDHARRHALLGLGQTAMVLAVVCGLILAAVPLLPAARWAALLVALPVAGYGLGMGANLVGGRLSRRQSSGAVDDGAAVAVLLGLGVRLHGGGLTLHHTAVTLLLTVGEEAQMQGALAYVDGRAWPLPACTVNLEVLGQDGSYLHWRENGTATLRRPMDPGLNDALARAVEAVTGHPPAWSPLINDDALAFLRAGIPAVTLGSLDTAVGDRGLHSALDHPGRVLPRRLDQAVEVLLFLLATLDGSQIVRAEA
jgi:hypothetical protein